MIRSQGEGVRVIFKGLRKLQSSVLPLAMATMMIGGASSVRGVGDKTINIAVENDASNTIVPGLEVEFTQQATAFADWCNAAGGITGRKIVLDNRDAALFNVAAQMTQACQTDFMAVGGGYAIDASGVPIREKCGLG